MQRAEQSAFQADPSGCEPRPVFQLERECKAAGALGFSIRSYRVRLSTRSPIKASMAKRQTRWFERPVSRDVPVRFWLEAPKLWPCGGTADTLRLERSVFGRAGATPA